MSRVIDGFERSAERTALSTDPSTAQQSVDRAFSGQSSLILTYTIPASGLTYTSLRYSVTDKIICNNGACVWMCNAEIMASPSPPREGHGVTFHCTANVKIAHVEDVRWFLNSTELSNGHNERIKIDRTRNTGRFTSWLIIDPIYHSNAGTSTTTTTATTTVTTTATTTTVSYTHLTLPTNREV